MTLPAPDPALVARMGAADLIQGRERSFAPDEARDRRAGDGREDGANPYRGLGMAGSGVVRLGDGMGEEEGQCDSSPECSGRRPGRVDRGAVTGFRNGAPGLGLRFHPGLDRQLDLFERFARRLTMS